jgi:hypothetical protein
VDVRRSTSGELTARKSALAPGTEPARRAPRAGADAASSAFHSPQAGHWPCHCGVDDPQAAQTKSDLGLAKEFGRD